MILLSSNAMPRRLPPGCVEDKDRHDNVRIYFRAKGKPKIRLRGTPWTPEFMAEYEAAKGCPGPSRKAGISAGTWRWLCTRYFSECTGYKILDDRTKRVRRAILESTSMSRSRLILQSFLKTFPCLEWVLMRLKSCVTARSIHRRQLTVG